MTLPLGDAVSLAALPGGALVWAALIAAVAAAFALRSGARPLHLGLAVLLGLLVPAGWVGTGFVLYDDFDPIALQSLSFTAPFADTLFWSVAATSIPASFGVGLIGGTLGGALVLALLRGEFQWQSFESPAQTGRYIAGAVLMGVGGVLAGGCTVGAGLAGIPDAQPRRDPGAGRHRPWRHRHRPCPCPARLGRHGGPGRVTPHYGRRSPTRSCGAAGPLDQVWITPPCGGCAGPAAQTSSTTTGVRIAVSIPLLRPSGSDTG